jgi:hypothetical protein
MATGTLLRRVSGGHKDAEGVTGRIGVHAKWLLIIIRTVEQELRTKCRRPGVLEVQFIDWGHGEIEVELLGNGLSRPSRGGERRYLLKGDAWDAGWVQQDEPVRAASIDLTSCGRLIAGSIAIAEQLSVELSEGPRVRRIQDDLPETRVVGWHRLGAYDWSFPKARLSPASFLVSIGISLVALTIVAIEMTSRIAGHGDRMTRSIHRV